MFAALRTHLCAGRRVYGEGGGAAYLCRQMETPSGEIKRMAGILPAVARLVRKPAAAVPVEVRLARSTWLGREGARLRGYHNPNWRFEPFDDAALLLEEPEHRCDLISACQTVGSLIHLDFAADADCLDRFFDPEPEPCASLGSEDAPFSI